MARVGPRRASPSAADKRGGEAFPLLGRQKTRDRKLAPARYEEQLQQSELLVLLAVELGPERIQRPFRDLAAVADLAEPELRRRHGDLLEGRRGAVVGAERPIDQQHIEAEEADHRPCAHQEKEHAAGEAHATDQRHHQQEAAARQRAVRRDDRRKKRGLGETDRCRRGVVSSCCPQYRAIMAKKQIKKRASTAKAVKKARKGRAAKVKPAKARARADEKALHGKTKPWKPAEVEEAFRRFQAAMPEPKGELHSVNPFTLLVAVVLSAQATDAGVNKATPALFALADTPEKMVALGEDRVRELIKTIGLFRTKAKNVIALSEKLIAEHGGQVPNTREALQELPGVGRKTANVVLNMAFGQPTMAVDTHIFRIGNRTGLGAGQGPAGGGAEAARGHPREVHDARASLADPARPLHVSGAAAAVREMRDRRFVQMAGEDGARRREASATPASAGTSCAAATAACADAPSSPWRTAAWRG